MMKRATYNGLFAYLTLVFGGLSLAAGVASHFKITPVPHLVGVLAIGICVLVPPITFWVDWVVFAHELDCEQKRDFAKHRHDLSRNIWIALAGILVYLFGIPFPGTSGG
jgi:hypothetical protein